jgi:hypothetical protein
VSSGPSPSIKPRRFAALAMVMCAFGISACGGGGGSSNPVTGPVATPTATPLVAPAINAVAPFSVAASAPYPAPGAGSVALTLPANPLASGQVLLPIPSAGFPANGTASEIIANAVPSAAVPFSGARAVMTARTPQDAAPATVLFFFSLTSSTGFTLPGTPSFVNSFPSGFLPKNAAFYIAYYNPLTPALGWQRGFSPVGSVNAAQTQITVPSGSTPITVTAGVPLLFILYAVSSNASAPTPAPSATSIVDLPIVSGSVFTYSNTENITFTAGPAISETSLPPNRSNRTWTNTITILDNQTFNGVSNLYDLQNVPGKASDSNLASDVTVMDQFEGFSATPTGADLLNYGFQTVETTTAADGSVGRGTETLVDTAPQIISHFPDVVASFDVPVQLSLTDVSVGTNSAGATSSQSSINPEVLRSDGTYHSVSTFNQTIPPFMPIATVDTEDLSAPPLSGTLRLSSLGSSDTIVTVGAPVANSSGKFFVPYNVQQGVAQGLSTPAPFATMVPLWYANGVATPISSRHVNQLGSKPLPAACAVATNIPTTVNAIETLVGELDPFFGSQSTFDTFNYIAPGVGPVCSIQTLTTQALDATIGQVIYTEVSVTVSVLTSVTTPKGTARRPLSIGFGGVFTGFGNEMIPIARRERLQAALLSRLLFRSTHQSAAKRIRGNF